MKNTFVSYPRIRLFSLKIPSRFNIFCVERGRLRERDRDRQKERQAETETGVRDWVKLSLSCYLATVTSQCPPQTYYLVSSMIIQMYMKTNMHIA